MQCKIYSIAEDDVVLKGHQMNKYIDQEHIDQKKRLSFSSMYNKLNKNRKYTEEGIKITQVKEALRN